jgi:diguanylate cyclase (GGDEF)-like protein/PAS domain S-box-containing protein
MSESPGPGSDAAAPAGWWGRFHRSQLFDYNAAARRLWLALALTGAAAIIGALAALVHAPAIELWQVAAWLAIVAVAAAFPIQIPRSKHSIATGDIVIFLLLAMYGGSAAIVAAALEGLIGAVRSSARWSSRIASMAAGAVGMSLGALAFEGVQQALQASGLPFAGAHLAALAAAAVLHCVSTTYVLMKVIYLKRELKLGFGDWFEGSAWVGSLYLVSAVLAGMLSLNAQQFGRSAVAVGVAIIGLSLALLRTHFRQQIVAHAQQEARVTAAEQDAAQNQQRFHSAFTHASIGMAIVSDGGQVLQVNSALCSLLAGHAEQLLHRPFRELLHPGDASLLDRHVDRVLGRQEETFSIELRCQGLQRGEIWVSLHCALFGARSGTRISDHTGLIFQLHDITSRRRAEGELHHIAYHDSLTDLANRNCLHERLSVAVQRSREDARFQFALMYLDLDRFKIVNDSLGHPAGDELLKEVASRLAVCVRPRDLVARLGGDEFCILVEDVSRREDVLALGERLLAALARPVMVNGTETRPMASVGITFSDMGYREPDEMLRDADLAMYRAKSEGKGRLALFDASLLEQLGHKLQLESDLRRAIGEGQLSLVYQPLFGLDPWRLLGFEALSRWTHPVRGPISPAMFISLAEECGCIEALSAWAIEEAVKQMAQWREGAPQHADLVMHVNVSGRDLSRPDFVPQVREILARHRVPPGHLVLEITESTAMEQREASMRTLAELGELGVKLSIDDFGTGYSSLAYLSTLPFDCLKIDRSFVSDMERSPKNVEIVRTVLTLGRSLGKQVIAEGIETHEQLARLKELGAPAGQGYLLARPMPADKATQMLREPQVSPA